MSDFGNKISELNSLTSGNMAGELPLSLTLSSGTLATNKITLSQVRDLFDFTHAFDSTEEGIAATVENQLFYVYTDANKLTVNEYVRTKIGANVILSSSGTKKTIYIPTLLKHVKVQVESFEELRTFKPWWEGQVVYLKGYYSGEVTGNGEFIGHLGEGTDDGGMVASGNGFYWSRSIEGKVINELMYGVTGEEEDVVGKLTTLFSSGNDVTFTKAYTFELSSPILLPYTTDKQTIDGNGSTFICQSNFSVWNCKNVDGSTNVICYRKNFRNMIGKGSINKDTAWANVGTSHFISFSDGEVENIRGSGFVNVLRAFGNTVARNIWGDDLRNALWSCYATPEDDSVGNNKIFNAELVWASGDGLIIKGPDVVVDNFRYEYAGCISKTNEDEIASLAKGGPGAPRGVVLSVGADEKKARNVQVTNVVGKYYGAGGLNIQGDNIHIGGLLSLGDIYLDNFIAGRSGGLFWAGATNWSCGDITAGTIFGGIGLNSNCANFNLGLVTVESRKPIAGGSLISIGDSANSSITNGFWKGVVCKGQSQINDDIFIATEGIIIDLIEVLALNNQQGGYTVKITKGAHLHTVHLTTTNSASTAPVVFISGPAKIDRMKINRVYGTALTVQSTTGMPKIENLLVTEKQGTAIPVKLIGTSTDKYQWGTVEISGGASTVNPKLNGALTMRGYSGPDWKPQTEGQAASVTYPILTTLTV